MDLFNELEKNFNLMEVALGNEGLETFISYDFDNLFCFHFTLGLAIRNEILQKDSALLTLFNNAGIRSKDDMSALMINLFYIYKHNQ